MVSKKEIEKQEQKVLKDINNIPEFIAYIFKYRMKELLALIIVLMIGYFVASNLQYKDGKWEWIPSIKTSIEVKK